MTNIKQIAIKVNNLLLSCLHRRIGVISSALTINMVFLLLALLVCDPKWQISDDFVIDSILSGAYGQETGFLPYVNVLLGHILYALTLLVPKGSVFFLVQILMSFVALTLISILLNYSFGIKRGLILVVVFLSFFSDDLYIVPTYTTTAAFVCIAGVVGFLSLFESIVPEKERCIIGFISIGLFFFGTMLRFESFYIAAAFSVVLLGLLLIYNYRKGWNKYIRPLLLVGLLFIVAFLLEFASETIWGMSEEGERYKQFDGLRQSVTDVASYGYDSVSSQFDEIGLDATDYYMIQSWNLMDRSVYDDSLLEKVSAIKTEVRNERSHSLDGIIRRFIERGFGNYRVIWGLLLLFIVVITLSPTTMTLLSTAAVSLSVMIMTLYFFYIDRVVYRVECSILMCAAVVYLFLACCWIRCTEADSSDMPFLKLSYFVLAIALMLRVSVIYQDNYYKNHTLSEYQWYSNSIFVRSWDYDSQKYRIVINKCPPYRTLLNYIKDSDDAYFLLDFNSTIQTTYYTYRPWSRIRKGLFEKYSYFGGITTQYPENQRVWKEVGINPDNPISSITNDNIYVVDNVNSDAKLLYLQKYYYPNARKELVNTIDGFMIWKYYKE